LSFKWEEQQDALCDKIENDFHLQKFSNRILPITALTTNGKISDPKDDLFKKYLKPDCQKNLATIGDTVIDFLIFDNFLDRTNINSAQDLNALRERYGNNYTLHFIAKNPPVSLGNYIIKSESERCAETGKKCLAMYFEALIAIIYIEGGFTAVKKFINRISFFENAKKYHEME